MDRETLLELERRLGRQRLRRIVAPSPSRTGPRVHPAWDLALFGARLGGGTGATRSESEHGEDPSFGAPPPDLAGQSLALSLHARANASEADRKRHQRESNASCS